MKRIEEYKSKAGIFRNAAGGTNYYVSYFPKNPIANVVIFHGFCEFAEKYEEVIEVFLQNGYAVYLPEHRGHGYSQRECEDWEKVYIHSYQDYVQDLYCFIQRKIALKHKKLFLFAHSMGGAIGALFLEQYPTIFDAAVLSAPMFRMKLEKCPESVAAVLVQAACLLGKEKECIAYQMFGGTYGWFKAGISATRQILKRKNMKNIRTPILIFQAEQDSMVKNRAHVKFLIGTDHTSLVQIRGSKHEIFHAGEEQRREYYQALFSFLEEELSRKWEVPFSTEREA